MDNILVWDVRGLNSPNKQLELQIISRKYKAGMMGLVETKLTAEALGICKQKWFQDWESYHNANEGRGRIWFIWNPQTFTAELFYKTDQLMHMRMTKIQQRRCFTSQ